MSKMLLVCPKCYNFFSAAAGKRIMRCEDCNAELERVDRDYLWYAALSFQEKEEFKKHYVQEHYHADRSIKPFVPMAQSGWVSFIGCSGWVALVLCLLGSVMTFLSGLVLYAILFALVGALSCGTLILFAIMAEDVRHIRNQVDKLHHDIENEKKKRTA